MIQFNKPTVSGKELDYLQQVLSNGKFSGDGAFTKKCHQWFEETLPCRKALLTTSCTHALEMAAILLDFKDGDEVIMPSYTFSSTAGAFALHGARVKFVDIRPDTMNIDEKLIEKAITDRTRAIVVVHYAGISCNMDEIMKIAGKHNLVVVEDAAQALLSGYKGKALGTIGQLGAFSFHETKNIQCGEGGALIVNDAAFLERAEIIREKGTDRSRFFRGEIDKYSWVDIGSSYLPSELNAAFLYPQLIAASAITDHRMKLWNCYNDMLGSLAKSGRIELPVVPDQCTQNGHMYFIKTSDESERSALISFLKERGISSVFHYVPLHSSKAGIKIGSFSGTDRYTTNESERLLRLPLHYDLTTDDVREVALSVVSFYDKK